ncbi:MAG: PEP-CTERM sorting domain-containing protein [Rubrivivax sp.]|nr:MAG: PEP-CTERM sorting domain-containing protein [Rubrivivax sp.]
MKKMMGPWQRACAGALLLWAMASPAHAVSYQVTLLDGENLYASAINNAGQVIGNHAPNDASPRYAVIWSGATPQTLPQVSSVSGINDAGVILGDGATGSGQYDSRALTGGQVKPFGPGTAHAINNAGQMAGLAFAVVNQRPVERAILWSQGVRTELTAPGSAHTAAYAISEGGLVGGVASQARGTPGRAVVWANGQATFLGTVSGYGFSVVTGLNDAGLVIGNATDASYASQAVKWGSSLEATILPYLSGYDQGETRALNQQGQVVGGIWSADSARAVLWQGDAVIDLNSFMDASLSSAGWTLVGATDINDAGWIIGIASNRLTGEVRSFVSTPSAVPEPSIAALSLTALGVLALMRRRYAC